MKILVIHASAGAGHKKAAEAIVHGLKSTAHDVRIADALDYASPLFKLTYAQTYSFLVTRLPWVWGFFFNLLDMPFLWPAVRWFRRCYNGLNTPALEQFLIQEQFDCIISTQFLSAEVSAYLKRSGKIKSQVICVVTDFDVHRIWVNEGTDVYTGATDFTRDRLIRLGVAPDRVFVTGIPTDQSFHEPVDTMLIKQQLGLKPGVMTVLIATGSFGMGPIAELVDLLKGYQLLVVCGHNQHLYTRLLSSNNGLVHIYPLVDNMPQLMSVADVMVTKPGGLSIAEAMVKNLPMVFFSAIPGQEYHNVMVLKQYGVARGLQDVAGVVATLDEYLDHAELLQQARANLARVARPNAVDDIIRLIRS